MTDHHDGNSDNKGSDPHCVAMALDIALPEAKIQWHEGHACPGWRWHAGKECIGIGRLVRVFEGNVKSGEAQGAGNRQGKANDPAHRLHGVQ